MILVGVYPAIAFVSGIFSHSEELLSFLQGAHQVQHSYPGSKDILSVEYKKDRMPGNLGFDPAGFGGDDLNGKHNVEINTGRLAMLGVTSFLFREFVIKDL